MKRALRCQGLPAPRHLVFEQSKGDSEKGVLTTSDHRSNKQKENFWSSFFSFSPLYAYFSIYVSPSSKTRPSSALLKGHTCRDRLQRHKATWMLGTSPKHVPRQVPSKAGFWAMSPPDQPCWQLAEYLVLLELLFSTTISAGHSVFCSHLLIKPLLERNVSATKIRCFKLLLNI